MEKAINRLLIITAVLALLFGGCTYMFRNSPHASAVSEEKTCKACEYINIDVLRLDVTVIPYDGDEIRVSYTSELPLVIVRGDNTLFISESDKFLISLFLKQHEEFGLYLYLPRKIYREITIYTGGGSVKIGGVDSEYLNITTNSGDILSENTVSLSRFATGSGTITVDFDVIVEETQIESRSGNAKLIFPQNSSVALDYETISGDLTGDLLNGKLYGSDIYGFNGGERLIHAMIDKGTLTVTEKGTKP